MLSTAKKIIGFPHTLLSVLLMLIALSCFQSLAISKTQTDCQGPMIRSMTHVCDQADFKKSAFVRSKNYGRLPLVFEANQGQFNPEIKFMARGSGYYLYLTQTEIIIHLIRQNVADFYKANNDKRFDVLKMKMLGGATNPEIKAIDALSSTSNYFVGNDRSKWRNGIKHYSKAKYVDIYPNIDMIFYGNLKNVEYDFIVKPGANYKKIKLSLEGNNNIQLDAQGNLLIRTDSGDLIKKSPDVYQIIDGEKISVDASFVIEGNNTIGFKVAAFDNSNPLIIDPILSYASLLGGTGTENIYDIAIDSAGNSYVAGFTTSTDFNTKLPLYGSHAGGSQDVFISKLNPTGDALIYSTYLGGTGNDIANGIVVNANGEVYVTGKTTSTDFPELLPPPPPSPILQFQTGFGGGVSDAFVTKLNAVGSSLVYSTYLGGNNEEEARGIAINANDDVYVVGYTQSADFPTTLGSLQELKSSASDGFITKINANGSGLIYSTFLGGFNGSGNDYINAVAIDGNDIAYVAGSTDSTKFPTLNPVQVLHGGGTTDAFVAKIHPLGTNLLYSTYLGGVQIDVAYGIAVNSSQNAYVTGYSTSADFPTVPGSYDLSCGVDGSCDGTLRPDAFVTKLAADGSSFSYSTFLGGSNDDFARDIAINSNDQVFITGYTNSTDFPIVSPLQINFAGSVDIFVTRLDSNGANLEYSTYFGGVGADLGYSIVVGNTGNVYVAGATSSTDFPTSTSLQNGLQGFTDAYIIAISAEADVWVTVTDSIDPVPANGNYSYTIIATNNGPDTANNVAIIDTLPTGVSLVSSITSQGNCAGGQTVTCTLGTLQNGSTATLTLEVTTTQSITNTVSITATEADPNTANNIDSESTAVIPTTISTTDDDEPKKGSGGVFSLIMMLILLLHLYIFRHRFTTFI